jgi:hypothetical protein
LARGVIGSEISIVEECRKLKKKIRTVGSVGKNMSQQDKLLVKILLGNADANIPLSHCVNCSGLWALMYECVVVTIFSLKKASRKS